MESQLPHGLVAYKRTPVFDHTTLPAGLRQQHRTKPGVWALIQILEGRLRYRTFEPTAEAMLSPAVPGVARPEQPHEVELLGPVRMFVEFYAPVGDAAPLPEAQVRPPPP